MNTTAIKFTATGLFQYSNDNDLVEGSLLGYGSTPEEAAAAVLQAMEDMAPSLDTFSITEVFPGNPFDLPE